MLFSLYWGSIVNLAQASSKVVGFIDIGTNSIRLLLVRINLNHSYTILTQQKEVVRLGEGEFVDQTLQPEAMERAALVCRHFVDLAHSRDASEIFAVATSATREASNKAEFVHLLQSEAGLQVKVIPGREEARLIYLGVTSGIDLEGKTAFFIDIGGGSTEVIVGDQNQPKYMDTHRLGAIRLATLFFLPDESGPVTPDRYALMKNYVRNAIQHTIREINPDEIEITIGSSGSIINLAEVASYYSTGKKLEKDGTVTRKQISETLEMLCSLPLDERRKVTGINPERADIIIPGGAILETFMEMLDLRDLRTNELGLQHGMLIDYLERNGLTNRADPLSMRARSVLHLGRSLNFDEEHGHTVAKLALELFDSIEEAELLDLDRCYRELLEYAALLHDIGSFISYDNHHVHSCYLIRNANLVGFNEDEINVIAYTTLLHRKGFSGRKYPEYTALNKETKRIVKSLSAILRLAESLDRSHAGNITQVKIVPDGKKAVYLEITAQHDSQLELWAAANQDEAFQKAFGKKLEVKTIPNSR